MDPTAEAYKNIGVDYPEGEIGSSEAAWMRRALLGQSRRHTILEFGSGLGLRSRFLEEEGFRVQRSDVAGSFLEHLQDASPPPLLLDLRRDPLPRAQIFYASAVLLHFPKEEIPGILRKIYEATLPGGIFFFSLKEGQGQGWEEGSWGRRYFAYWQEPEILAELLRAGWERVDIEREEGQTTWIQIIARRS